MARFKGEKVTFIHGLAHSLEPDKYPPYSTRGKVVDAIREPFAECFHQYLIEWEDGSSSYAIENMLLPRDTILQECPIKIGELVRFVCDEAHMYHPQYYPAVGTEGTVTEIVNAEEVRIQWPEGSTCGNGNWCAGIDIIEHVGG